MKPANQNEVDILLRSLARREGGVSAQLDTADHLDADELNAFAEGMVTERARARHAAHLADCANCRGIVINLTQSAGVPTRAMAAKDDSTISFWQQLTAFFSQPVLRFVIPVLVLVSILGIGMIALRQDSPGDFVAQRDTSQPPNLDQANQAVPSQSPAPTETNVPAARSDRPVAAGTSLDERRGESAGTIAGVGASEGPSVARKQADAPASQATPTFAPDLAAPAPPPAATYEARDRTERLLKEEAAKSDVEAGQSVQARPQASDAVDRNKAATAAAKRADNQPKQTNVHGLMREGRAYEDKDKNASERTDTRTVSGKRFIRQNNSWMDAAYQQSRATTNVKRGSEQYRALIADEPGLRAFAEQLGGEVIVVWKGRAYRFY